VAAGFSEEGEGDGDDGRGKEITILTKTITALPSGW